MFHFRVFPKFLDKYLKYASHWKGNMIFHSWPNFIEVAVIGFINDISVFPHHLRHCVRRPTILYQCCGKRTVGQDLRRQRDLKTTCVYLHVCVCVRACSAARNLMRYHTEWSLDHLFIIRSQLLEITQFKVKAWTLSNIFSNVFFICYMFTKFLDATSVKYWLLQINFLIHCYGLALKHEVWMQHSLTLKHCYFVHLEVL